MKAIWTAITILCVWLWTLLSRLFRGRRSVIWRFERIEDLPDRPWIGIVYLAGEGNNLWGASMACPCGCGETIELNLLKQVRPCWTVTNSDDGTATLSPSVFRQQGCRSHFILRQGRIHWC